MKPAQRRGLGLLLAAAGLALLAFAAVGQPQAQPAEPASAAAPTHSEAPTPTQVGTVAGSAFRLGPEAATADAFWPTPTAIPTAGPPATWPSAPLRIVIPAAGIAAPVVEVGWHVDRSGDAPRGVWDTVSGAAGHLRGSADPGQAGNCVLAGHSSDAGGAVFRRLNEVAAGDRIELYTVSGQCYTYTVSTVVLLDENGASAAEKREHARWLDSNGEPVVTLVTCWPDWSYTHRLIVRGRLDN